MVLITRWNMMLCEYSWPLCTVHFCSPLIFLRTVFVWKQGKRWKYFKLRYGYLFWFSTLSHFSFCVCLFFYFQKENLTCWFFFLNVIATKMYIFKNCESVIWCSLEIKKKKLYRFNQSFNLFSKCFVFYFILKYLMQMPISGLTKSITTSFCMSSL